MRAVVLTSPGHVDVVDDWPEPQPGPDEVLIEMRGVGLCGSDLGVYDGERDTPELPWVMGHEGGGDIIAVGGAVKNRTAGQRVVIEPNYCCFDCPPCRSGRTSACVRRRSVGLNQPGLLAERVAVPAEFTWPVPADFRPELLACTEPLAVARAAVRRSGVRSGDECLVLGAGSQGLFVCQSLLAIHAEPHVVEPHTGRLELAERIGAKPAGPAAQRRYQYVFETSGSSKAWRAAIEAAASTGTVVVIGMSPDAVQLTTHQLVRRQLTVKGAFIYDHPGDFAETVAAVATGDVTPQRVVHKGFRPDQAAAAFAGARAVPGKSWIDLTSWPASPKGERT